MLTKEHKCVTIILYQYKFILYQSKFLQRRNRYEFTTHSKSAKLDY